MQVKLKDSPFSNRLPDDWPSVVHAIPNLYCTKIDVWRKKTCI